MSAAALNPNVVDLAEFRLRRAVRARAKSRTRQQFLWSWPTGQFLAAEFPLAAAPSYSFSVKKR